MSKEMSNIERQVMASVGVIYTTRKLTGVTALKFYVFFLSVWYIGRLVWVSKVFTNFFAVERLGFGAMSNYLVTALQHTHVAVQFTLVVAIVALASFVVDIVKAPVLQRTTAW